VNCRAISHSNGVRNVVGSEAGWHAWNGVAWNGVAWLRVAWNGVAWLRHLFESE
jgi:hypothetical protein